MAWTDAQKLDVWKKATEVEGVDSKKWRQDQCGAWMQFDLHGDRGQQNNLGWEIDHITAKENGGKDEISNLRPLHWYHNVYKSDGRLVCVVRAVVKNAS